MIYGKPIDDFTKGDHVLMAVACFSLVGALFMVLNAEPEWATVLLGFTLVARYEIDHSRGKTN